ncbi:AAA family ATPase [Ralstonia soli]|uniref:AAA family ATPase n=1 Tax=Ralstonia soli TaxID=2953896 RepID=A0ABT1ATW1_9RALS|nr:AAA family ATPase [Ralstonia soli]MCO5401656.1 AAA family ATPase [Ralstonia soli]
MPRIAALLKPASQNADVARTGHTVPHPPDVNQYSDATQAFTHCIHWPRLKLENVAGMKETKQRLRRSVSEILDAQQGQGIPRNGILLFGEPGNGKSLLAEALAGEFSLPILSISFGDVASKWINETPQKIRAVFDAAREISPCVLFIDEIDSLLKPRDGTASAHSMDRDVVNTMLTEIVGLRTTPIVFVAATNFLEQLDAAAIREGRFDFKIEIPPPDLAARISLLTHSIGTCLGPDAVDKDTIHALAERWDGFSAARLRALGKQLQEMQAEDKFSGKVSFAVGRQAMRFLQGRGGHLPPDVKPIEQIIMPGESRHALDDLADRLVNADRLESLGASLPTGLLFYGPPGTGKTQAAMALARASEYAFLQIDGADIIGRPDAWDRLIREARDLRPAIVFIDEADDVLADRRHSGYATLTNKILTTLDGARGRLRDVVFIAATNHYDRLDQAALRSGRYGMKVRFDIPSGADLDAYVASRIEALTSYLWVDAGALEKCQTVLRGRTIADVDALINEVLSICAIRDVYCDATEIQAEDVDAAARALFGMPKRSS